MSDLPTRLRRASEPPDSPRVRDTLDVLAWEAAARIRQLEAERDAAYLRGLEDAARRMDVLVKNTPAYIPVHDLREHIPAAIRALYRTSTERESDTPTDTLDLPHSPTR